MIPPRDQIKASFPTAARAVDAATVLARLAARAKCHPSSHPSELRRPLRPFISCRAETATIIPPAAPGASPRTGSVSSSRPPEALNSHRPQRSIRGFVQSGFCAIPRSHCARSTVTMTRDRAEPSFIFPIEVGRLFRLMSAGVAAERLWVDVAIEQAGEPFRTISSSGCKSPAANSLSKPPSPSSTNTTC
jgi:hypothetical protein